ncbi:flagellar hook-associated protein FlgL [Pseudomonas sp. OIL-1]|uniref:flagellar hook-associated protein FlgL n=1 Tax=Pseudomonas sp. OIL-1 TaxID=2706126 RepID=UPI0013A7396D|nr:flagellar hook-associated protein FlgL [Pseudomonas sp. OIL-1]QIB51628.1 flagellar hook-associated protein FlgL [Pseudomonas sp. OIL-1]
MRISTIQAFNNGVQGMQNNYSNVTRTQEQISSGKRIMTPADDPVGSVRLLQLDQQAGKLEQYKGNLTAANNSLMQEEATLNSVNNILQRVREITLEAGNGALDQGGREALAQELAEREKELFGLMNSKNARGEYLFGGYKSDEPPFVKEADGSYNYKGDEGQRFVQIAGSKSVAINDNGKELFVDISNTNRVETRSTSSTARISLGEINDEALFNEHFANGGSETLSFVLDDSAEDGLSRDAEGRLQLHFGSESGGDPRPAYALTTNEDGSYSTSIHGLSITIDGDLSTGSSFSIENKEKRGILDTISLLRTSLENGGDSTDDKRIRSEALSVSLQNLDNAMNKVLGVQTSIGARMNVIESTQNEHAEAELINTTVKSGIEDLDYAEALSRLSLESVVLQAAQQSFVKISGMSLFNLLR